MPSEDTKILEFSQRLKSNKTIFIIYADFESLKKKTDGYKNYLERSSVAKVS